MGSSGALGRIETTMASPFCGILEAVAELKAGRLIVLVDDEHRENEGDLVCAAEAITPELVNFMLIHARGVLCVPMTRERCQAREPPRNVVSSTCSRCRVARTGSSAERPALTARPPC